MLQNGDIYVGLLCGGVPEGSGKYLWSDGCMYEGQWINGKITGLGRTSWPSGATYEGNFWAGFPDGIGTFMGVNSSIYKGNWSMNIKTGYGTKSYDNGDVYEGSWIEGMPDGKGRYIWKNGNEYVGEWRLGAMSGIGWLRWGCGDKYDGEWLDGLQHGHGIYTWADGSTYVGTWKKGLKDGKGTFIPPRQNPLIGQLDIEEHEIITYEERSSLTSSISSPDIIVIQHLAERISGESSCESSKDKLTCSSQSSTGCEDVVENCQSHDNQWNIDDFFVGASGQGNESKFFSIQDEFPTRYHLAEQAVMMSPMVERLYVEGVLINELLKGNLAKPLWTCINQHIEEPTKPGETISEGHQSYDLMVNLQCGIRYTVEKTTLEPEHEIGSTDFGPKARIWKCFSKEGSQFTPHQSVDFKWKDYCPMVFRHLRELFKIDATAYMLSICGNRLRELSSPGKSGSVFYLSHDDKYMIKTIRKSEVNALLGMLANYYRHVQTFGDTLITKFFGLHQIKPIGGHKVRFVVMGNMFCTELPIHRKFDLKGSSHGRYANKVDMDENTTFKDLDLDFVFRLQPSWHQTLIRQIECDCKFLESEGIMDYSLLLGIHFRPPQFSTIFTWDHSQPKDLLPADASKSLGQVANEADETKLVSSNPHVRGSPSNEETNLFSPGATRLKIQLGVNMPGRADRQPNLWKENPHTTREDHHGESHDVVLYFGIIDVLQVYDMGKKLENAYKSFQFEASSISAIDPYAYSRRFRDFMCQIFLDTRGNM